MSIYGEVYSLYFTPSSNKSCVAGLDCTIVALCNPAKLDDKTAWSIGALTSFVAGGVKVNVATATSFLAALKPATRILQCTMT